MKRRPRLDQKSYANLIAGNYKGPFTLAIFAAILAAIFAAIFAAIPRRFESPVVYTGDLKSRLKSQQKSPV